MEVNSWILTVPQKNTASIKNYFFCSCSHQFMYPIALKSTNTDYIVCPVCGNNYFKDADEFLHVKGVKVWKYFYWESKGFDKPDAWEVELKYFIPQYFEEEDEVRFSEQILMRASLKKDGSEFIKTEYLSNITSKYRIYTKETAKQLNTLLVEDIKQELYLFIMTHRTDAIAWLHEDDTNKLQVNEQLKCLQFFLKNHYLKEFEFFFWNIDLLHGYLDKNTSQLEMLHFIGNNSKVKVTKKALYQSYTDSLQLESSYNPYSDYIFARTIKNNDLLRTLYEVHPFIKKQLFSEHNFLRSLEFIEFLKLHYTQKQIVKLFAQEMQDKTKYKQSLSYWSDTLLMLGKDNAYLSAYSVQTGHQKRSASGHL